MEKMNQRIEEYKLLRSEIMYYMNKDTALLTCLFSAVTATLFFALKAKMPEGCMLAFLIIIPICSRFAYHQKQMAKISSYMVQYLEPELEIKWETRISGRNMGNTADMMWKSDKRKKMLKTMCKFSDCLMMGCATICSHFYLIFKCKYWSNHMWLSVVEIIANLIFLGITLSYTIKIGDTDKYRRDFDLRWDQGGER